MSESNNQTEIEERLVSIFADVIVVDSQFRICAVSQELLSILKYSMAELTGREITAQLLDSRVLEKFRDQLLTSTVCNIETWIRTSDGRNLPVVISGFNLQLLSSTQAYTMLKVQNPEIHRFQYKSASQRTIDFEHFAYRASHDLLGPVATILGIINLVRLRKDDSEINYFFDLIHAHAEKLNQNIKDMVKH